MKNYGFVVLVLLALLAVYIVQHDYRGCCLTLAGFGIGYFLAHIS